MEQSLPPAFRSQQQLAHSREMLSTILSTSFNHCTHNQKKQNIKY